MSLFGGGHKSAAKTPTKALGIDFQGAQYGPPIPVVYGQNKVAGNCIWYGDFQAIAVQQKQSGGKGGGGSSSTTSYDYKASYQLGICEGPGSIVNVYNGTSTVSLSSLGAVSASGAQGQAPWSHLTGGYALGYSGTVLVSFPNRDLGSSASLPNDNFEVAGLCQFGSGIVDANPAAIIADICTNQYHGINFGQLGNTTQYSNYCVASGIFLSPVYDQQQTAQQTLSDLLKYTNADAWFSEGVLKIGCYADQSLTGNGATYTPNVTAVANLGPNDFITNGSEAPVTITRKSPADAMNIERLEYVDRANTYHTSAVTATIDNDVVKSGARSDQSDTYHGITTAAVARLVVQNILQRKYYVRNQYEFQLSWRYCYLEPFDIVTLTDANTGLQSFPVRILSVEEDEHGLLKLTAEEFPSGIGHGGTYNTQANGGATVDPNSDPGPVASPYLFRGPGFLVSNNKPEIWCAVTGNGNAFWAGCDVYLSHDGTSYTFLSTYARQARYGELTNSMGVQADPDTTSAPNVVLNGYNAQLLGGSQADADNFVTLAMIDSEIVSYETATLASGPSYNLSYLRRGGYGSTIAAHAANAPFVRLDDGILRLPIDPSMIGQTVYLKFLSRNCFGRTPRTLAEETAYTYVVGSNVELPDVPNIPDSFAVQPVADGVSITWSNDNPAAVGCTSIEYATASSGPFTVLAQVGPTTTAFHHSFTSGATYYYRARARGPLVQSGWSAYTAEISSTGKTVENGAMNLANHTQDDLADGSKYARVVGAALQEGLPTGWTLGGSNLCPNPSFESNLIGAPIPSNNLGAAQLCDDWTTGEMNGFSVGIQQVASRVRSGTNALYIALQNGYNVPNGATLFSGAWTRKNFPCVAGDTFYVGGYVFHDASVQEPTGVVITNNVTLRFYNSAGVAINNEGAQWTQPAGGSFTTPIGTLVQAPAGAVSYKVYCFAYLYNSSGAAITSNAAWAGMWFDDIFVYSAGDALTVAGSGSQVGDQRNLNPITWAGVRSVLSASPIAYTITNNGNGTSTVNFSVASVQLMNGSNNPTYAASSGSSSPQTNGTTFTYYLFYTDLVGNGGSFTLQLAASIQQVAGSPGNVMLGSATVTVASSGGGGGGTGGGGGGYCVCDDMWIDADTQAKNARPGHLFDCCDLPTRGTETFKRALQSVDYHDELCVRITTEGGAQLDCGHTTPFDTVDGRVLRAPDMHGELVLTDDGLRRVASVESLGIRRVCYFHFGGISYAAGRKGGGANLLPQQRDQAVNRIYSHNAGISKP